MPRPSTLDPAPLIGVTSRLMQDYRIASPVTNSGPIVLVPAERGMVEAFAVGADGRVRNIYPDPAADSGWNLADLGSPPSGRVNSVAALRDASGTTVYALDTSNGLYTITDRRWGPGWQPVAPPPMASFEEIKVFQDEPGRSFLAAQCRIAQDVGTALGFYILNDGQWESVQSVSFSAVTGWSPGMVAQVPEDTPVWPGVFAAIQWSQPPPSAVLGLCDAGGASDVYGRFANGDFIAVTTAMGAKGYCEPFVITSDGVLCHLVPAPESGEKYALVPLSGTTKIAAAAVWLGDEDRLEVLAVGADGILHHGRQDTATPTGWTQLLRVEGDLLVAQVAVAMAGDGSSQAVAVSTGGQLYQLSREPDTGDWLTDEIELPIRGAVDQYTSYTLRLSVSDTAGLPAPGADVTVYSDGPVRLEINGRTCFLDAATPWHGRAGQDGELTIGMAAAETLNAPSLSVWTSVMPDEARVLIDPSGAVRAQLAALDDAGEALLAATSARSDRMTYTTEQLVQGDANRKPALASWASQTIKQVLSLAGSPPAGAVGEGDGTGPRNDPAVARYVTAHDGTPAGLIHLPSVPEQHWRIDLSPDQPVLRLLSRDQAEELLSGGAGLAAVTSVLGLAADWADVFAAIRGGAASVADIVVSATTQAISTAIRLVIDGVTYLFNAVIDVVGKLLDLAQTILDRLKVTFERLAGWLGWVPDWSEILRTHRAVSYMISQLPDFAAAALTELKNQIVNGISAFEARVSTAVHSYIDTILPAGQTIGEAAEAGRSHWKAPVALTDQTNVFGNAFLANLTSAGRQSDQAGFVVGEQVSAAFQTLVEYLTEYATQFQSAGAFSDAISYFTEAASDPDNILTLGLAGLIELAEAIALLFFDLVKTGAAVAFDAIIVLVRVMGLLIDDPWDMWLVSDLYAWLTGGSALSTGDLFSLLIAIPATAQYKQITGTVPFPADADLAAFEANFSAARLIAICGLKPVGASPAEPKPTGPDSGGLDSGGLAGTHLVAENPYQFARIMLGVSYLALALLEPAVDVQPPLPEKGEKENAQFIQRMRGPYLKPTPLADGSWKPNRGLVSLSAMVWVAGVSVQVFSNPVFMSTRPDDWSCADATGIDNIWWAARMHFPATDLACMLVTGQLLRSLGEVGAVAGTFFGAIDGMANIITATDLGSSDPYGTSAGLVGTIPEMLKMCRSEICIEGTAGLSLPFLAVSDGLANAITAWLYGSSGPQAGPRLP